MKTTQSPKPAEIERQWWVVDGAGVPVGRLSTRIARVILGKGKPIWAPHVDCGDFVIVVNAEKVVLTGGKERAKIYYRHTTTKPGSPQVADARSKCARSIPTRLVESAVFGMLPKTKLGRKLRKKLKVYAGGRAPPPGAEAAAAGSSA